MTQLILTSKQVALTPPVEKALQALPPVERMLMAAAHAPSLVTLPKKSTLQAMIDVIQMANTIAGQKKSDPTDAITMAKLTYRRIHEKFPTATLPEIAKAVENGVYGQYGEYYGINAKSLVWFVEEYMKSPVRAQAREEFRRLEKLKPALPSGETDYWKPAFWTEANMKTWSTTAQLYYQHYLEGNPIYKATPEGVYWVLLYCGKIEMNEDREQQLFNAAKLEMTLNLYNSIDSDKGWKLKAIEKGDDPKMNAEIVMLLKRKAVIAYFAELKELNHLFLPW